jgi:hypothetical protein
MHSTVIGLVSLFSNFSIFYEIDAQDVYIITNDSNTLKSMGHESSPVAKHKRN